MTQLAEFRSTVLPDLAKTVTESFDHGEWLVSGSSGAECSIVDLMNGVWNISILPDIETLELPAGDARIAQLLGDLDRRPLWSCRIEILGVHVTDWVELDDGTPMTYSSKKQRPGCLHRLIEKRRIVWM